MRNYINENFSSYIFEVLDMLKDISIHCKITPHSGSGISTSKPENVLQDLSQGKIKAIMEVQLSCSERILKNFFTQAYADIKDVFYDKSYDGDNIEYKLYVEKMIGGKIRTIDFERESAGTQHILEIVRSLLGAFCGVTVVYDKIDNGIHDLLLKNVLVSMLDEITGQLIITTHNTFMLETIDIKSAYVINVDYLGNKEVKCLNKYPRIQGTNNPRNMYLKGLFGGVLIVDIVDYDEIIETLQRRNLNKGMRKMPFRPLKYTKCVVIVHGKSELNLVKYIYTNLHLSVKIIYRDKGKTSIQINGLLDFMKKGQFRNLKSFAEEYAIEYDRKNKCLKNFKLFIIMDTDDCNESTKDERGSWKYS
jgi:Predicted ATPases